MTTMPTVLKRDADTFCLKWDGFHENVTSMFDELRQSEKLVDVTLCSESQKVKVHRLTMSACSPYLRDLLKENPCEHPVIVLTDTTAFDLNAIVKLMYKGVVDIPHNQLENFMKTLEILQIQGSPAKEEKAPPAHVVTRLSSSRPAVAEASTSEQRSPCHEPHRSSPRPAKRRRSSVQESPPLPRTASPFPPPTPEPDTDFLTNVDREDLESQDRESPAVDPLFCPESEEQLLALEKQRGDSADLVKAEEAEIDIEENVVGVDETLSYDAEFDLRVSDNELSAGNSADDAGYFLPPVGGKPDPTNLTGDEKSLNDDIADVSDPVCRPVRTARICYDEALHAKDSNDESSGDGAEDGRLRKDEAQEGGRYQPRRITRLRQTDTASRQTRQTDTGEGSEDAATKDKRKQPPDPSSGAAQSGSGAYHCQLCNYACISQAQLDQHICHLHGHAGRKGRDKCEWCDIATNRSQNLKQHRHAHTEERPHFCKVCDKAFKTSSGLITHKRTHTGEKPYHCTFCGKAFPHQGNLIIHKRTHTGERPYTCDVCGKTFVQQGHLIDHRRRHTGERPYTCDVCGKTFAQQGRLIDHKRTHSGERPYTCDVCGKTYVMSGHLISHKRTHTGERPYTCDICGKTFLTSGTLIIHRRTHTGERPYNCDVCGKTFAQQGHLIKHKRTHTGERPYTCDICGKTFSTSGTLIIHKRTHTDERPYTCDVCDKTFARTETLIIHKRTHTGERPYTCDVCGKTFAHRGHLIRHIRTHTLA